MVTTTNNRVHLWSLPELELVRAWDSMAIYGGVGFGSDGRFLASSNVFGQAHVVRADTGAEVSAVQLHVGAASYNGGVVWSDDGKWVALLGNGEVRLMQPGKSVRLTSISDGWHETFLFRWSDTGRWFAHISQQCRMVLRDRNAPSRAILIAEGGDEAQYMSLAPMPLCSVRFDDPIMTTFHPDHTIRRWSLRSPEAPTHTWSLEGTPVPLAAEVELDPAQHTPVRHPDGSAGVLDLETGIFRTLGDAKGPIWWIDSQHLAVGAHKHLDVYDTSGKRRLHLSTEGVLDTGYLGRGNRVRFIIQADGDLRFVRLADGRRLTLRVSANAEQIRTLIIDEEGRYDGDAVLAGEHLDTGLGELPAPTPELAKKFFEGR